MSKLEIELKILEIDTASIETILINAGAKKIFDAELEAVYFIYKDIVDKNSALRLRREGDEVFLTHKIKDGSTNAKSYMETEIKVDSFENAFTLVSNLGYNVYNRNRKFRQSYKLGDVKFEIDDYKDDYNHIPAFLEIEVSDESLLDKTLTLLGYTREDAVNYNFFELAEYYENH